MTQVADPFPASTDPQSPENDPRDPYKLPPLGQATNPDNWGTVNGYMNLHAQKCVAHYDVPCNQADTNLRVLEHGKAGPVKENDVIANTIRNAMNTLMSVLLRDSLTRKIMPSQTNDPPVPVEYVDRQTMTMQQFPVTEQIKSEIENKIVDWHWDKADLDADVWMATFNARTAGWYTAPFEWDWAAMLPRLRTNISVRQTPLDPSVGPIKAVESANYCFLRRRINWWQARSLFPKLSKYMAHLANDGSEMPDPILQLGINQQVHMTGEKMVDLTFMWIRNYPVQPMTPQEAIEYGEIEMRPTPQITQPFKEMDQDEQQPQGQQPAPATPDANQWPTDEAAGNGQQAGGQAAAPPTGQQAGVGVLQPGLMYLPGDDQPITPADPAWPWWLGIRRLARVAGQAIAEDRLCPYWDIELLHMPANPLPLTACGQGDPELMHKLQAGRNNALTNAVEHSFLMAHPVTVFCQSAWDVLPAEYKEKGASVGGLQTIVNDDLYKTLGGKISVVNEAPPISSSVGQILEILDGQLNDITPAPSVLQGKQTGDITGWQAQQQLQSQATSRFDLPSMFLQMFTRRLMNLVRHSVLWFAPIERLKQICSEYPPEVVEYAVTEGRETDRDIQVIVNTSAGGAQDRKKSEAVQQFGMVDEVPGSPTFGQRVIGMKTLRDAMGVDNNRESQLQQIQPQQQEQEKPSEQISFKDLPPAGQQQMAAQAGIQLSPQDIAAKQQQDQQAAQQKSRTTQGAGNGSQSNGQH